MLLPHERCISNIWPRQFAGLQATAPRPAGGRVNPLHERSSNAVGTNHRDIQHIQVYAAAVGVAFNTCKVSCEAELEVQILMVVQERHITELS